MFLIQTRLRGVELVERSRKLKREWGLAVQHLNLAADTIAIRPDRFHQAHNPHRCKLQIPSRKTSGRSRSQMEKRRTRLPAICTSRNRPGKQDTPLGNCDMRMRTARRDYPYQDELSK